VAAGVWPSREAMAEAFVRSLLALAERKTDPVQRTRLQALAGAAGAVGTSVLSTVWRSWLRRGSGTCKKGPAHERPSACRCGRAAANRRNRATSTV
jgi:hypothetical protein